MKTKQRLKDFNQARLWLFVVIYGATIGVFAGILSRLLTSWSSMMSGITGAFVGITLALIINHFQGWFLKASSEHENKDHFSTKDE